MLFIFRVIDKRPQKYPVRLEQMTQQVIRAHFVALVGRVRQSVYQIENVRHVGLHQPRLRTIFGPSQLAKPKGMRRHAEINTRYLTFEGLFCGTLSRL